MLLLYKHGPEVRGWSLDFHQYAYGYLSGGLCTYHRATNVLSTCRWVMLAGVSPGVHWWLPAYSLHLE